MKSISHSLAAVSIVLGLGLGAAAQAASPAGTNPLYGRWTINEENPRYTAKGRVYKTIDIAPCGKDFCGVSVSDTGRCGAVLFRFLTKHGPDETLHGHAPWGNAKKNIQIQSWEQAEWPGGREMEIFVGDGYDFGGRSESMPKFHGEYKRIGAARCTAR